MYEGDFVKGKYEGTGTLIGKDYTYTGDF